MKEYTKQTIMNIVGNLVVEQIKELKKDAAKDGLDEDLKFEIFFGSNELLGYGLSDLCEAFSFAEKYLENYESIQAEIWKDGEGSRYSGDELNKKITELVFKTNA